MYVLNACMQMSCNTLLALVALFNSEKKLLNSEFVCTIYTFSKLYFNKPWYFPGNHFLFFMYWAKA